MTDKDANKVRWSRLTARIPEIVAWAAPIVGVVIGVGVIAGIEHASLSDIGSAVGAAMSIATVAIAYAAIVWPYDGKPGKPMIWHKLEQLPLGVGQLPTFAAAGWALHFTVEHRAPTWLAIALTLAAAAVAAAVWLCLHKAIHHLALRATLRKGDR
jgi:hypothetical protein